MRIKHCLIFLASLVVYCATLSDLTAAVEDWPSPDACSMRHALGYAGREPVLVDREPVHESSRSLWPTLDGWRPSGSLDEDNSWNDSAERPHWRKNIFRRFLTDQKFLVTTWAPADLRRPKMFLPLLGATAGAATSGGSSPGWDIRLSGSIAKLGQGNGEGIARGFSALGDGTTGIVLVGGTYFIARWSGKTRLARATSLSSEALLNTALWSSLLKRTTRRARPSAPAGSGGAFFVSDPEIENNSFPSGHAMGAFAVAAVFSNEYRDKRWVPWVVYGTAGLVAASRVALNRHYVSDVVVGALLGNSLGRMVSTRQNGMESGKVIDRFTPIFEPKGQRYGLQYNHSW